MPLPVTFDPRYALSVPFGVIRVVAIVIGIIVVICTGSSYGNGLLWFTCINSIINTFIYLLLNMFHFPENYSTIPWTIVEFVLGALWTVLYFISFIICAVYASTYPTYAGAYGADAFFCIINSVVYGFLCFLLFRLYREQAGARMDHQSHPTSYPGGSMPPPPYSPPGSQYDSKGGPY